MSSLRSAILLVVALLLLGGFAWLTSQQVTIHCTGAVGARECTARATTWGRTRTTVFPPGTLRSARAERVERRDTDNDLVTDVNLVLTGRDATFRTHDQGEAVPAAARIQAWLDGNDASPLTVTLSNLKVRLYLACLIAITALHLLGRLSFRAAAVLWAMVAGVALTDWLRGGP